MHKLIIRELKLSDEESFLSAMQRSQLFHEPSVYLPLTHDEFIKFYNKHDQPSHKCFLLLNELHEIVGGFTLNAITRGIIQNAYLVYYVVIDYAGKGYMSKGIKLILEKVFMEIELHRLEALIEPTNISSINLVKMNYFRKEGLAKRLINIDGEWRDFERWAITCEDWLGYVDIDNI